MGRTKQRFAATFSAAVHNHEIVSETTTCRHRPVLATLAGGVRAHRGPRRSTPAASFGGISMRNAGQDGDGYRSGHLRSVWNTLRAADGRRRRLARALRRLPLRQRPRRPRPPSPPATASRCSRSCRARGAGLAGQRHGEASRRGTSTSTPVGIPQEPVAVRSAGLHAERVRGGVCAGFLTDVRRPIARRRELRPRPSRHDMSSCARPPLRVRAVRACRGNARQACCPNDQVQLGVQFRFLILRMKAPVSPAWSRRRPSAAGVFVFPIPTMPIPTSCRRHDHAAPRLPRAVAGGIRHGRRDVAGHGRRDDGAVLALLRARGRGTWAQSWHQGAPCAWR